MDEENNASDTRKINFQDNRVKIISIILFLRFNIKRCTTY